MMFPVRRLHTSVIDMSEKKSCIQCQRQIDAVARICPFCNWDQSTNPSRRQALAPAASKPPDPERRWRGKILGAGAFLALVIASFAVGTVIHGFDVPDKKDDKNATASVAGVTLEKKSSSDIPLVPAGELSNEPPVTSAPPANPAQGVPTEAQRSDATALPSDQYVRIAAQARAAKKAPPTVDPRTIAGTAYGEAPPPRTVRLAGSAAPAVRRTNPEPLSQPIPSISVPRNMTASLNLTIGADGRVKEVAVLRSIPDIGRLIGAVQSWKFRPATENGVPVASNFKVDISFRGHE
jgi:Gram-negative bacterial TonB protein C-terminal